MGHNSVRFKCACARGVARALINRPLSTSGRRCVSGRAVGVWGEWGRAWPMRDQAACARAAPGAGGGEKGAGAGGEGGEGVCLRVSFVHSLAGALHRSLPGRESGPGCGRGRVRERSVPEREGRPARWARTEPRRAGGRRGAGRWAEPGGRVGAEAAAAPSPAVRAGAPRPALLLLARRGELRGDLAALQPGDWGCSGTSHAPYGGRAGGLRVREAGAPGQRRVGAQGRCGSARAGWVGVAWPSALPCAALFISLAASAS